MESLYLPIGWEEMRHWLDTPLGRHVIELEKNVLQQWLSQLYGHEILLVGEPNFIELLDSSTIPHKIFLHPKADRLSDISSISSRQDKMSLATESVEVIVMPHCLEFMRNPHEVLREAYRVLMPEGSLIITGFNPYSLWGVWKLLWSLTKAAPWVGTFRSEGQIVDWLTLLGFDIDIVKPFNYSFPIRSRGLLKRTKWYESFACRFKLPFNGAYLLLASKHTIPLTPIRPHWKSKKQVLGELVKPSARS